MSGLTGGADRWMPFLMAVELKGVALLALCALAALALRRGSAAGRHWVWLLGVTGLLALPLLQAATPRWTAALPAWTPSATLVRESGWAAVWSASPRVEAEDANARPTKPDGVGGESPGVRSAPPSSSPTRGVTTPPAPVETPRSARIGFGVTILGAWLAITLALLARLWASLRAIRRLEAGASTFPQGRVTALATRLAREAGVARQIRLLMGAPDAMPMSWGWRRPVILLPEGAGLWPRRRLAAVLLHELAHVRRGDCLTQLVAEVTVALHWVNPLGWLAARRLRLEREYACDDLVLGAGARASDYAHELLALARTYRFEAAPARAAVAMARRGSLSRRLRALLDATRRRTLGRARAVAAGAAAAGLVVALAAFTLAPETVRQPEPERLAGVPSTVTAPAAAHRPTATTLPDAATPQEATCGMDRGGWKSVSHQSHDDRHRIEWSKPGCTVELLLDGDVDFSSDFDDVSRLGRGARLRIEETDGRTERFLEITAGDGGRPEYDYRLNRQDHAFDGAARAWYEGMLLQLFRRGGFMAHERVASILARGGVAGVLSEMNALDSDYVFATYAEELLQQAHDLTDTQALEVVNRARDRVDSDYYLTTILQAFAVGHLRSDAMLDAYLAAAAGIESDYYRSEVLKTALDRGGLSTVQVAAVLKASTRMDSDYYKSEVLTTVGRQYTLASTMRATYLEAVSSMDSDYYKSEVLGVLLDRNDLAPAELASVLRAARGMDSDSYVTGLLQRVASAGLSSDELRDAYLEVAGDIDSDHYRTQALSGILEEGRLPDASLARLISAAAGMDSDYYKAEVLSRVARDYRLEGTTRQALVDAVNTIDSSYYRAQVAALLMGR